MVRHGQEADAGADEDVDELGEGGVCEEGWLCEGGCYGEDVGDLSGEGVVGGEWTGAGGGGGAGKCWGGGGRRLEVT